MTNPEHLTLTICERRLDVARWPGDPDSKPLVLLHEGLGSIGLWRAFPTQLQAATGRRVVAYSRFGHGQSEPPPKPRTPTFFHDEALEVLRELLSQLAIEEPILVGHSDGGSIALIYAANNPATGVVLMAPHVFVEEMTVEAIRGTRSAFETTDLRSRMSRHHADPDAAFWGWCDVWLDPAFKEWTLDAEARRLTAPTLLIQGAEDPYGTLAQIHRIAAEAPEGANTDLLIVPGGHSPHLEQADAVTQAISEFVARLP